MMNAMTQQQDYPAVLVRDSDLEGKGAFAGEFIAAGSAVLPLTGKQVVRGDFDERDYSLPLIQVGPDSFLLAQGGADDYINHSCNPNLRFSPDGSTYVAVRDIAVGEELSFDYSTSEDDPVWTLPCLCGTADCRGTITGFGRLAAADRKRLYPWALPYLREKYKGILSS